jgi:hypothetical protein
MGQRQNEIILTFLGRARARPRTVTVLSLFKADGLVEIPHTFDLPSI